MNPVAVLQLLQSLQGLSQLAQLTSNLGGAGGAGLGPALGGLSGGGGMGGVGAPPGISDPSVSNPLAALTGLGMLGSNLGLGGGGGGGGGSGASGSGMGPSPQGGSGTSGRQVFVRNVSTVYHSRIFAKVVAIERKGEKREYLFPLYSSYFWHMTYNSSLTACLE